MGHDDPSAREVLQFGPGPPRRGGLRWPVVMLCCLVLAGVAGLWLHSQRSASSEPPAGAPPAGPTLPSPAHPTSARTTMPPRIETMAGLSFLDAASDYALFVRSDSGVYRAMPRADRLIRTEVSAWQHGSGIGYLVAVDGGAIARGVGGSAPVIVPDDGLAQEFVQGAAVLPGPDSRHVWMQRSGLTLVLVGADGTRTGATISIPEANRQQPHPDGQGYALVQTASGVYDLRPGSRRLVSADGVVATGPDRILVRQCSGAASTGRCGLALLDGDLRPIRTVWGFDLDRLDINGTGMPTGVISPDHRFVAIARAHDNGLQVLDLDTGDILAPSLTTMWWVAFAAHSVLAFSPDSRWLFVIDDDQHVDALDVTTGEVHRVLPDAFPAEQLTIRP